MKFAHTILENYRKSIFLDNGIRPFGQLAGMKKLLAKGESGIFWAKDFDITGAEMSALSHLSIIQPTGKVVEIEAELEYFDFDTQGRKPYTKAIKVHEWELLDYDKLQRAYELLMALIEL
jgi:hypothetical protein